jgi:hypothetical protein
MGSLPGVGITDYVADGMGAVREELMQALENDNQAEG